MNRKLAFSLSLVAALGAGLVHALGLGEATIKSSLNQPLNAEIELVNVRELENGEILPGLASREDFLRSGIERIYFLSDMRFEVVKKKSGKTVVELTTKKPVREPFLNFLVEVIWPSGRLLREYALLIDPPIFDEAKAEPVLAAKTFIKPAAKAEPEATTQVESKPSFSSRSAGQTAKSVEGTYGPTTRKDTLWQIALEVRPDKSVTAQQTMLAIQDLNPDAFIDANINQLKSGQVLRVPGIEDIRARSKRQAVRDVVQQNEAFADARSGKKPLSGEAIAKNAGTEQAVADGEELRLVVATPKEKVAPSQTHAGESTGGGQNAVVEQDVAVTLEQLDKANIENHELKGRVEELEEQLNTIQRLLALKDDELASLQNQLGQASDVQEMTGQVEPEVTSLPDESEVADAAESMAAGGSIDDNQPVIEEPVSDAGEQKPVSPEVTAEKPVGPIAKDSKEVSAPVKADTKEPTGDIFEMIISNPLYQIAIVVGLVILALILWLISKSNAKREQEYYEQISDGEEGDVVAKKDVFAQETQADILGDIDEDDEESSPAPDGEADDPLASAEIYIAYGRSEQAIEVLENAISAEPARSDLRLKLLGIYASDQDIDKFDAQYEELKSLDDAYALDEADKLRESLGADTVSIDELESQLLSGNALSEPEEEVALDMDFSDALLDENELEEEGSIVDTLDDLNDLDIDLKGKGDVPPRQLEEDNLDIDFDISDLDLGGEESPAVEDRQEAALINEDLQFEPSIDESVSMESEGISFDETPSLDESLELDEALDLGDSSELDETLLDASVEFGEDVLESDGAAGLGEGLVDESLLSEEFAGLDEVEASEKTEKEADFDLDLEGLGDLGGMEGDSADDLLASIDEDLGLDDLDDSKDFSLSEMKDELASIEETLGDDVSLEDLDESDLEVVDSGDFDMSELDDESLDLDLGDDEVSLDMDDLADLSASSLENTAAESVEEGTDEDDFDFLSGTDEAATKLDLARAYIDMGDVEGARDILEEVAVEGNDDQQKEATGLLRSIE